MAEEVNGEPTPVKALKVLEAMRDNGWTENPFASFAVRGARPDAEPFFAVWHCFFNEETGKRSWRFANARAKNGQPLNYTDIFIYLENPLVIYPEPPEQDTLPFGESE